jgi:hypothetical protein
MSQLAASYTPTIALGVLDIIKSDVVEPINFDSS